MEKVMKVTEFEELKRVRTDCALPRPQASLFPTAN